MFAILAVQCRIYLNQRWLLQVISILLMTFMEAFADEVIAVIFSLYALPAQYNF
jgi:hypothetical protein